LEGGLRLWRNKKAYDRVLTPTQARVLPAGSRPRAADFSSVDFNHTLLLYPKSHEDERLAVEAASKCRGLARVEGITYGNSRIDMHVRASEQSWITISDIDFPGWRATASEVPLQIWRANGLYRAVCVPAGDHYVRLRFNPISFLVDARSSARFP
jgi:hypothetical protein